MDRNYRLQEAVSVCRQINRASGKSYYWATSLFPKEKQRATFALYAFFRLADDIVDAPDIATTGGRLRAERELLRYRAEWLKALKTGDSSNPVLFAAADVCRSYQISDHYSDQFLDAMLQDIFCTRYQSFDELSGYMKGSAVAVGKMMSNILGVTDPSAFSQIGSLASAMQLTNFLRDVDEDYHVYNRIYLPIEDLDRFNLNETDIATRRFSDNWRALMEFEAERTRTLYSDGDRGIALLNADVRLPVKLASVLYSAILGKLKDKNWNVFAGRAKTSFFEKLVLTVQTASQN